MIGEERRRVEWEEVKARKLRDAVARRWEGSEEDD